MAALQGKYFVKKSESGVYQDITTLFDGVRVLSIDGFDERGKIINAYHEQWINSQEEDFIIANEDEQGNPVPIYENCDIEITFIVSNKYASQLINVRKQHDLFVAYITTGKIWLKSMYEEKEVPCASLESYKPTVTKLQRGAQSFMMGTLKLHTLNTPKDID